MSSDPSPSPNPTSPALSVIVVVYDMEREAPRTLHSLSVDYQQGVTADTFEVLVVDNGSPQPLGEELVKSYGRHMRYLERPPGNPSPVAAVNQGIAEARGRHIAVLVDGARLLTPGWVHHVELATRLHRRPIVAVPGWHLGPQLQSESVLEGYGPEAEDNLLETIDWPEDGYRLFEIGTLAASNGEGWFRPMSESNAVVVSAEMMSQLGGFDEGFVSPGGGLCNLDFFGRALELEGIKLIVLLGEGTFHQIHGGLTTGQEEDPWPAMQAEYETLRERPFERPNPPPPLYLGHLPTPALRFVEWSARRGRRFDAGPVPEVGT